MRTITTIAATLGVIGGIAASSAVPAAADWYHGHHHRYFNYGGGFLERLSARLDRSGRRL